jgi:hypothetical protein
MALEDLKVNWSADDYYNFDDLNRVENALSELSDKVSFFTGQTYNFEIISNRTMASIETYDSLNRIESNTALLGQDLNKPEGYIEPFIYWFYNKSFSYQDANRLEQNLQVLNNYVTGNIYNIKYCGMTTTGDEGVI